MKYVDVCIGNEEDAELCLGFKPDADVEGGHTDAEGYKGIFRQMMDEFGYKISVVTIIGTTHRHVSLTSTIYHIKRVRLDKAGRRTCRNLLFGNRCSYASQ